MWYYRHDWYITFLMKMNMWQVIHQNQDGRIALELYANGNWLDMIDMQL